MVGSTAATGPLDKANSSMRAPRVQSEAFDVDFVTCNVCCSWCNLQRVVCGACPRQWQRAQVACPLGVARARYQQRAMIGTAVSAWPQLMVITALGQLQQSNIKTGCSKVSQLVANLLRT